MRLRTLALSLAAGIATALLVTVVVTELAAPRIAFSLFLGIPAGLAAGALATAAVAFGLGQSPASRRYALAAGAFGGAFLLALVAVAAILETGTVVALAVAVVVGLLAAGVTYWRVAGRTVVEQ
ncbi:MAG: hypothetical protein ABEJ30_06275 [Halorientalis sp.]